MKTAGLFRSLGREERVAVLVGAEVAEERRVLGGHLRVMQEVDEGVGQPDLPGRPRDDQVVDGDGGALPRDGERDVGVLLLDLEDVAAVAVDEEELAGGDAGLVLLVLELGDVALPAQDDVLGLPRARFGSVLFRL